MHICYFSIKKESSSSKFSFSFNFARKRRPVVELQLKSRKGYFKKPYLSFIISVRVDDELSGNDCDQKVGMDSQVDQLGIHQRQWGPVIIPDYRQILLEVTDFLEISPFYLSDKRSNRRQSALGYCSIYPLFIFGFFQQVKGPIEREPIFRVAGFTLLVFSLLVFHHKPWETGHFSPGKGLQTGRDEGIQSWEPFPDS